MTTSNLRKAAVLLKSLPEEQASRLIGALQPEQASAVSKELKALASVGVAEQERVLRDFAGASVEWSSTPRAASVAPLRFLHDLDADALLTLIADEHPQAISLLLCHLPPRQAGEVLAGLATDKQLSVVCRMATMKETNWEVLHDVEAGLRRRMMGALDQPCVTLGVSSVVRMFQSMDPAAERHVLDKITEAAPDLADEIRRAIFSIEADNSVEHETARMAS